MKTLYVGLSKLDNFVRHGNCKTAIAAADCVLPVLAIFIKRNSYKNVENEFMMYS